MTKPTYTNLGTTHPDLDNVHIWALEAYTAAPWDAGVSVGPAIENLVEPEQKQCYTTSPPNTRIVKRLVRGKFVYETVEI